MTISSAILSWSQNTGQIDERGKQRTEVWSVVTNAPVVDGTTLAGQAPLPSYGDQYESTGMYARVIAPVQVSVYLWQVTVIYRTPDSPGGAIVDPLNEPATIRGGSRQVEEAVDTDGEGNALINSAGEPYAGLTRPFADDILYVTKNTSTSMRSTIRPLLNTTNDAEIYDEAKGTALLASASRERVLVAGVPAYWRHTFEWHIRIDGWKWVLKDEGYRIRTIDEGPPVVETIETIRDEYGHAINRPRLLDGNGQLLEPGAELVKNTFVMFPEADHSPLEFT